MKAPPRIKPPDQPDVDIAPPSVRLLAIGLDGHCQSCLASTLIELGSDVATVIVSTIAEGAMLTGGTDAPFDICLVGEDALRDEPDWQARLTSTEFDLPLILVSDSDNDGSALSDVWLDVVTTKEGETAAVVSRAFRRATRERRLVARLKASEKRYNDLVASIPVIVYALDSSGIITYCEGEGLRMLGARPEDFRGQSLFAVGLNSPEVHSKIHRLLSGETVRMTTPFRDRVLETIAAPGYDRSGALTGAVGVAMDVTERHRVEQELRLSRALFDSFMDHNPAVCFIKDEEGRYVYGNAAFVELTGNTKEGILGKNDYELFSPDVAEQFRVNDARARSEKRLLEFQEVVSVNQTERVSRVLKFPVPDAAGRDFVGGIAVDVTDLMRAQRELERSQRYTASILDSVQAEIAVADADGTIRVANRAWVECMDGRRAQEVPSAGPDVRGFGTVWEWLECDQDLDLAVGIARMLEGSGGEFMVEYSTPAGSWFLLAATPLEGGDGVVVSRTDVTEHRMVAIASRERRRLFHDFMDNTPVLTYVKDRDGRHVFVNRPFCELMKRSADEIIGKTDFELWPEETATRMTQWDRLVLERREPAEYQSTTVIDGETHHWMTVKFVVRDPESGEIAVAGTSIDITARVLAEQELRKSEERFQLASRATNDVVWDWDLQHDSLWFSANMHLLFGYPEQALHSPSHVWWVERIHDDDRERVVNALHAAVATERENWSDEYRFRKSDGSYAYVLDRGHLMYGGGGRPLRMIGAMTDITARRLAEEALRSSEEQYRQIVETAQEGVWVTDANGVTTLVNARMPSMLGTTSSDLIGRTMLEYTDADGAAILRESMERRRTGEADQFDFKFQRADGTSLWTIVSASPIFNAHNEFVGMLQLVNDITPRKIAERELQQAYDRLEARVRERTAEIEAMMKALEEVNVMQRRFIADASHDLRTPLTVISAEIDLLLTRIAGEPAVVSSLQLVAAESRRLALLARDLLAQAAIDAQRTKEGWRETRIDELLLEAVASVQPIARDRGIAWDIDIDDPVVLLCDMTMLKRAFINVLDNAVKYSPDGSAVDVRLRSSDDQIVVTCRDRGPGIPERDLPHVFDRFYRSDPTRSRPGTGLGLSIVKSVVEAHGGNATIHSGRGGGTTVRIVLPR